MLRIFVSAMAVLVATSVAIRSARAQIVNVQPLVGAEPPEGASGSLDAAFTSQGGNSDVLSIAGQLVLRYHRGRHLAFALGSAAYGESDGERNTNKDLEHLRYRIEVREPFELEVFGQHERDEFRRLWIRMLTGAGPRLHFHATKPLDVGIGAAYMLEYEELQHDGFPDAGEVDVNHRLSTYASFAVAMGDPLSVGFTLYVQPRFDDFGDYRILGDLAFLSTVTKRWAIKFALSMAYDSRPPFAVKGYDATRTGSISLTW